MQALTSLRTLINDVPERLKRLPESKVGVKPDPTAWSGKEELGHLLDSAANNHQRIVRTKLEESCFFAKRAMASKPENQDAAK